MNTTKEKREIIMDFDKLPQNPGEVLETNTRDKSQNQVMRDTIVELKRIIREQNLDGLTACQIGVNERIMVLNFNGDLQTFVNPLLVKANGFTLSREKCVHFPGKEFLVPRNKEITLTYETPLGAVLQSRFIGRAAYVAQHLIWHMDGMYVDEVGIEIDEDWDKMTDDEKAEVIKQYAESVDVEAKSLQEELKQSEEAQKMYDAIEFDKALVSGEVTLKDEKVKIINTEEKSKEDETSSEEKEIEENGENSI